MIPWIFREKQDMPISTNSFIFLYLFWALPCFLFPRCHWGFVYIPSTQILKQFRSNTWVVLNLFFVVAKSAGMQYQQYTTWWTSSHGTIMKDRWSILHWIIVWTSPSSRNSVFFQEICIFMNRVDIPLPLLVGREHFIYIYMYMYKVSQCFHLGKIWRA